MKKFTIYERRIDDEYVWEVCLTSKFKPCTKDSWFGGSKKTFPLTKISVYILLKI